MATEETPLQRRRNLGMIAMDLKAIWEMSDQQPKMAAQITYEVHVQRGTRWEISARYGVEQKHTALREAKTLERMTSIDAVKVVKEVYRALGGGSQDFTVYKSSSLHTQSSRKSDSLISDRSDDLNLARKLYRDTISAHHADDTVSGTTSQRPASPQYPTTVNTVVIKNLTITLIRFGLFIAEFVTSALTMAKAVLLTHDLGALSLRRHRLPAGSVGKRQASLLSANDLAELEISLVPEKEDAPPESGDEDQLADQKGAEEITPEEPEESLQPDAEQLKTEMMKFLRASLEKCTSVKDMDNFNKFGVNLFLAGASEALSTNGSWDEITKTRILREAVETLGFNRQAAESFAQNIMEYLLAYSRYMQMYQAGRSAMIAALENDTEAHGLLAAALAEWNAPKKTENLSAPVAVMFTEIVDITDPDQPHADKIDQVCIHAHNRVVRAAIHRYAGHEVKRTADGIMAYFDITSNALEAAIMIQRDAMAEIQADPSLPLHIRIGINTGELIREDNDLYGSTVQLSARILQAADRGKIFVSKAVYGMCAGQMISFHNVGDFELKGFPEPVTLYEVAWDASNDSALSDSAASESAAKPQSDAESQGDDTSQAETSSPDDAATQAGDASPACQVGPNSLARYVARGAIKQD